MLSDWVRPYRVVRKAGKWIMVYQHKLYIGLRDMGESWLSWNATPRY